MSRISIAAALALAAMMAGPLEARAQVASQETPVVVELFTAQGCSSCPPADAYFAELAERDDVIALALHVDYWDYLGWTDKFGSPAHTKRQREYAARMGERMIYTPQLVVQGREHVIGSRPGQVDDAIDRHADDRLAARVAMSVDGASLQIEITPLAESATTGGQILIAAFESAETVEIRRGENRGHTIEYRNIVLGWSDLGPWRGEAVTLTAPRPMDADGVAVLVQEAPGGPIIGAGRLMLR